MSLFFRTKYPLVDGMDDSFQCVPEDIIRRRIAVYCPNIVPQCRKMDIDLPQHCAASKFQCRSKKVSKSSQVDRLFSMFGFGLWSKELFLVDTNLLTFLTMKYQGLMLCNNLFICDKYI